MHLKSPERNSGQKQIKFEEYSPKINNKIPVISSNNLKISAIPKTCAMSVNSENYPIYIKFEIEGFAMPGTGKNNWGTVHDFLWL
jgi:hypothetical protein